MLGFTVLDKLLVYLNAESQTDTADRQTDRQIDRQTDRLTYIYRFKSDNLSALINIPNNTF